MRPQNKFCENCRAGISIDASRVRALKPEMQALYANSLRAGFWKRAADSIGGGDVRLANNTITCDGPWLVVYRDMPPPHLPWEEMPDGWIEGGVCRLSIAKGTLVPASELHSGRKTSASAQPGSAPHRTRQPNKAPASR